MAFKQGNEALIPKPAEAVRHGNGESACAAQLFLLDLKLAINSTLQLIGGMQLTSLLPSRERQWLGLLRGFLRELLVALPEGLERLGVFLAFSTLFLTLIVNTLR